jgi:hypothetical protein
MLVIQFGSVLYLCTCLLNSPKAIYKISKTKEGNNKQTRTHKQGQTAKQGNLCNLDNKTIIINK